jgi:hypothetical protein
MKKKLMLFYLFLILNNFNNTYSQNNPNALNQSELLRQFEGIWTCEIGKDTTAIWEMIPYGSGFDAGLKYVTMGKTVKEGKGLYGYDRKLDKIVEAGIPKGKDIGVYAMWFISEKKWILIPYADLENPGKASFKMEGEFKSPDNLIEMNIENGKTVKIKSWKKSK